MPKRAKSYRAWLSKRLADTAESERYLRVAMADSSEAFLVALRKVAEARSMAKVAEDADVNRENLYRALSKEGNPRWDTINAILEAMGMFLQPTSKQEIASSGAPPSGNPIVINGIVPNIGYLPTTTMDGPLDYFSIPTEKKLIGFVYGTAGGGDLLVAKAA